MVSRFDHSSLRPWIAAVALLCAHAATSPAAPPTAPSPANDYPTYARVQYVQDCMVRNGGSEADLYKCSCAIDRIAAHLNFDQYVEASTYAHYASLGGENAGIFRDHPRAQEQAKLMHSIESAAWHACGLRPAGR